MTCVITETCIDMKDKACIEKCPGDWGGRQRRAHLRKRRSPSLTSSRSHRVAGKRVLITGAARGLGRSHALRLAEEGADLILVDICQSLPEIEYELASEEDLAETVKLVVDQGRLCISHVVDVRDDVALRNVVDDAVENWADWMAR